MNTSIYQTTNYIIVQVVEDVTPKKYITEYSNFFLDLQTLSREHICFLMHNLHINIQHFLFGHFCNNHLKYFYVYCNHIYIHNLPQGKLLIVWYENFIPE